jgi:polyisoprenoid-binding protein YceI
VGNTTAAAGKGFAIASAALTALALFAAFVGVAGISHIDIYKANVLAGLFIGAMIPYIFSALAISAVGRAAMDMVQEVRRQFREIPGIMEYKAKPEYEKCVAISTKASIREMLLPGAIALITPVFMGFVFGPEVLGGVLAGVTVSGVLLGIFQNNAGGAWDNAKKSFEKGVEINGETFFKKSEPHKASVTGDTVGDPFKDTSGPSMNILIKLMSIVSLVIAPYIAVEEPALKTDNPAETDRVCMVGGKEFHCRNQAQCDSVKSANRTDIAELKGYYKVDAAHSSVDFSVKHIVSSTKGSVRIDSGFVFLNNTNGPKIYVEMDMTSLSTQNMNRDKHLREKSEFFESEKHKGASFSASEIATNDGNNNYAYAAKGKLTMKGFSRDATVYFNYGGLAERESDGKKMNIAGFEGETTINRQEFGISGSNVPDEVKIQINLEAVKEKTDW